MNVQTADGKQTLIEYGTEIKVQFNQIPNTVFTMEVLVLDSLTTDILLGLRTLRKYKIILDLNKNLLKLDEKEIEIPNRRTKKVRNEATEILSEKLLQTKKEDITAVIAQFKKIKYSEKNTRSRTST